MNPFKQLVDRRLWPIALLLVAALVAVPFVLKDTTAEPTPPQVAAVDPSGGAGPDDAVVSRADDGRTDESRSVLGDRKDPFRPAQVDDVPTAPADGDGGSGGDDGGGDGGGGAELPGAGGASPDAGSDAPEPAPAPADDAPEASNPQPAYELHSLVARFGLAGAPRETRVIERLTGLPRGNPAVLYVGLMDDRKTAAFLVDEGVEVTGDGRCRPAPEDCRTLTLKVGETEFFTVGDATFQLDLKKILTEKTFDAGAARAARRAVAKGGRRLLRRLGDRGLEYSAASGTVARVARSARRARAAVDFSG